MKDVAQYRTKGPGATARLLLGGLKKAGQLEGRLLNIGSGIGALTFELLDRRLTSAVGVDLSSAYDYNGKTHYFCALGCKAKFDANPGTYAK